ncbi:MAG TPA: hypothetical protein VJV22_02240 [Acidobacteriaceae bacterium]|nr:hypothetical protein [Acidobacteriaceae bacterium]
MFSRLGASLVLSAVFLFGCSHLAAEANQTADKAAQADAGRADASNRGSRARSALHHFGSDTLGPYTFFMALATAGIHQATNNPPDWHQGFPALSERFGSNMGITATGNAVRYGLAYATDVDLNFEKCRCTGLLPRIGHAFSSTAMARRRDGSSVLSFPNLIAPYAATTVAVYGWYPARYDIRDALRMGNYNLLNTVAANIAFEFIPTSIERFLHHLHVASPRMPGKGQAP